MHGRDFLELKMNQNLKAGFDSGELRTNDWWLGECKCVILFVCNAGRNDVRLFSNETFGLVGRLLRRDVRTVIAPPAPLRHDLPAIWLDPFLESLWQGESIGAAHAKACAVIRAQFPHPCAWGALQLFGEHRLSFVREEIEPALQR